MGEHPHISEEAARADLLQLPFRRRSIAGPRLRVDDVENHVGSRTAPALPFSRFSVRIVQTPSLMSSHRILATVRSRCPVNGSTLINAP